MFRVKQAARFGAVVAMLASALAAGGCEESSQSGLMPLKTRPAATPAGARAAATPSSAVTGGMDAGAAASGTVSPEVRARMAANDRVMAGQPAWDQCVVRELERRGIGSGAVTTLSVAVADACKASYEGPRGGDIAHVAAFIQAIRTERATGVPAPGTAPASAAPGATPGATSGATSGTTPAATTTSATPAGAARPLSGAR